MIDLSQSKGIAYNEREVEGMFNGKFKRVKNNRTIMNGKTKP